MIDKNVVTRIVDEWLEGKDYFLVDVTVTPDDKIVVEIDHAEGVWIDDCVELSRYIESKLDREEDHLSFTINHSFTLLANTLFARNNCEAEDFSFIPSN